MTNTAMQKPAPRRKSKTNSAVLGKADCWRSVWQLPVVAAPPLLGQADAAQQAVAQQPAAQVLEVERQPSGELLIRQDPRLPVPSGLRLHRSTAYPRCRSASLSPTDHAHAVPERFQSCCMSFTSGQ